MNTYTKYSAPIAVDWSHVGVNDVVRTPEGARAVLTHTVKGAEVVCDLGFPKRGLKTSTHTAQGSTPVDLVGNVKPQAERKPKAQNTPTPKPKAQGSTPATAEPKTDRMAAARAAKAAKAAERKRLEALAGGSVPAGEPIKVQVDAVAQTTPADARPQARPTPERIPAQVSGLSLTDRIAAKLAPAIERLLDQAIDQAIENALR